MAEQSPWRAIQPPKLPLFTGEADGCDADVGIYSGGGAHPPELQDGGRNSSGVADPGFGGICPEGGAHPRSRGGRHSGPSFGGPRSHLRRPPGPLCSAHLVPRPAAGDGGDARHLLMLTTKLNAAQADAVNPAMLCDRFIDGLHIQARAEAQRWMREDADVEVRAEQVLVAQPQHNKEVEELRAQVAALTAKTAELQAELRHQSTRAPRPKVCHWCEQPGHFQQDCAERRQYVQRQQSPRASFKPSRPQPRFYATRHSAGPRFPLAFMLLNVHGGGMTY